MYQKKTLSIAAACLALSFAIAVSAAPEAAPASQPAQPVKPVKTAKAKPKAKAKPAKKIAQTWPDDNGYYNAAQSDLGANAAGSGAAFNKDWLAIGAISPESGKSHGTLFSPLTKGRVDITLARPVDIKAIETVGLDYNATEQPKAIDIYVDGNLAKHADLPETPGKAFRIPLEAKGQKIAVVVTDEYPRRTAANGTLGPNYGGWERIRVLTPDDLSSLMKVPSNYVFTAIPAAISPTSGALAEGKIQVYGEPRTDTGHPNTIWDKDDINHYKEMLKTSTDLQQQYAALLKAMDLRISRPVTVPEPLKDDKGEYRHVSDQEKGYGKIHNEIGLDIANLGTAYVLSGDEKYGDYAKKLLLAYADAFPNYRPGNRPGFTHDVGILFDQRLSDATWLIQVARGYDLIHDLPSMTTEERAKIENDVLKFDAKFITGNHAVMEAATNWSAICTASVLITGYATDDQDLVNTAMYGLKGTKEKPTGGLYVHFGPKAIADDGMWSEGSTGYQFMAMEALLTDAEILWHHGINMYGYREDALKRLFDSPLKYAYPNLSTPAISDGGGGSIVGYESNLWELGYERYKDPAYFAILNRVPKTLRAEFQKWPVSVLYDLKPGENAKPAAWKSVNFFSVGFGILRLPDDPAQSNLTFLYGKAHSHGHPDKLTFDLYAMGERFMFDPGSVWYEQPLYRQWYHTTLAHNGLVVDQEDQQTCSADLLVFAPGHSLGMERGSTAEAYPGVTMDRSLFLTPNYFVDIYGAFAQIPHTMDIAYHVLGDLKSNLKLEPYAGAKLPNGYDALTDLKQTSPSPDAWSADIKTKNGVAHFFAPAAAPTEVLIGGGHYGIGAPPTIIERRKETASTVFANAVDISNAKDGYIRSVEQSGGLDKGYGLLTVKTVKGDDLCFTSFHPGTYTAEGMETDAQQAFITRDEKNVTAMYLAGGTQLKLAGAALQRSAAGLAVLEQTAAGSFLLENPSPDEASVSITLPALDGLEAFNLDAEGKRTGAATVKTDGQSHTVTLAALASVEFSKPGAPSAYDAAQKAAADRAAKALAEVNAAKALAAARSKTRQDQAAANPAPQGTHIVVQAEDFTAQGNGEVKILDTKTAAVGKSIMGFDNDNQWVEWTAEVPADGYYNLSLCYCTIDANATREIAVNGTVQEPLAPFNLPSTGGFANGADDWKLATAGDPSTEKPLLLKLNKGKNTIRLTNTGGHSNLDYLVITSPDVKPTRIKP